jgi:hypothetical protein
MQQIKSFFNLIIIGILITIIVLQRSCNNKTIIENKPEVVIQIDTVYKNVIDTVIKKVPVKSFVYVKPKGPQYTQSNDIDTCNARFSYLLKQHIARRVYQDTLKIDSLGIVTVIDTVWLNKLGKRIYTTNIKIPTVTKTVTITKEKDPVRQLYIGGNIFANKNSMQLITPGILYKTRKDQVYQANVGINFDGTFTYGIGAYWKISFKK